MSNRPTARDLGIPFDGETGTDNAITDVDGVEVGHKTLIHGEGPLLIGNGPVRTGVTCIFPLGRENLGLVPAGWFSFNGNGEMTGTTWIEESGFLEGPILLTNTASVGTVRDAVIKWIVKQYQARGRFDPNDFGLSLPVVAETWDGTLNDAFGFHVQQADIEEALESASGGPVAQGNVGSGTGMICYQFKGGIGTSSRRVSKLVAAAASAHEPGASASGHIVGVLVQANHGKRSDLLVRGVPVGRELPLSEIPTCGHPRSIDPPRKSSILIIVATNAPLMPHQLKRLARRATLGLARTGTVGGTNSGDLCLAFSTANSRDSRGPRGGSTDSPVAALSNEEMDPLFEATTEATEEAIINGLVAAETMTGRDNHIAYGIPHARLQEIMRKYNRHGPF
jgi:L-aminopeptidase/D-esterase-like protein